MQLINNLKGFSLHLKNIYDLCYTQFIYMETNLQIYFHLKILWLYFLLLFCK